MSYKFTVMTQEEAEDIAFNWHYDDEYSFYDMEADQEDHWELERLTAYVDMDNYASARLLEKNNFVNEGILRSWVRDGDAFYDVYSYRILLSESVC